MGLIDNVWQSIVLYKVSLNQVHFTKKRIVMKKLLALVLTVLFTIVSYAQETPVILLDYGEAEGMGLVSISGKNISKEILSSFEGKILITAEIDSVIVSETIEDFPNTSSNINFVIYAVDMVIDYYDRKGIKHKSFVTSKELNDFGRKAKWRARPLL